MKTVLLINPGIIIEFILKKSFIWTAPNLYNNFNIYGNTKISQNKNTIRIPTMIALT